MGRDKKGKKSPVIKTFNKKTIIAFKVIAVVLAPIIYELLVFGISKLRLGTAWEEMMKLNLTPSTMWQYLNTNFWTYFSLVLCRIIIYTLPAILFFPFTFIKRDKRKSIFKTFLKCLNLQFLGYLIYQGIAVILALDYLIGLEPFSNIAIFMSMFGYIATISRNKNNDVEFGKINDNEF